MLDELERKRVWEAWLSSEIRTYYFAELSSRYHRRQRFLTWTILVSSSGAFVAFLAGLPEEWVYAAPALALLTAAFSAYFLVTQNQKNAFASADLQYQWNKIAREYERLWGKMYDERAPAELERLEERSAELSRVGTAFPAKKRALLKWQDYVEKHHGIHVPAS